MDQKSKAGLAPKSAKWHFWSADWHKLGPRPEGTQIEIKLILFDFLEIMMRPSSYFDHLAIFSSLPDSINRGWEAKKNS